MTEESDQTEPSEKKELKEKEIKQEKMNKENNNQKETETKETKKPDNLKLTIKKKNLYFGLGVVAGLLIILLIFNFFNANDGISGWFGKDSNTTLVDNDQTGTVKMELFVMSQCPYGTQAENLLQPILMDFGNAIDFSLEFVVSETDGGFNSLHGEKEVQGDKIQACAQKHYPNNFMNFVVCMNKNARQIPDNWESCAEEIGYDVSALKECYEGEEGEELLRETAQKTANLMVRASPTMFINDEQYSGNLDGISIKRALCAELNNHPSCAEVPEPVSVGLVAVTSSACASCDTADIIATSKRLFPGLEVEEVEAESKAGKQIIEKYSLEKLPAYIFGKKINKTYTWKNNPDIKTAFENVGGNYKLLDEVTGASYWIEEEKRKEYYEKAGIDLEDGKPQIDFYVMSYCPYGNIAEEAIEQVYQLLGDKAKFVPRYVIYGNPGAYESLHGEQELNQDIRELCVYHDNGIKEYFEFVLAANKACNYQNVDECWQEVAEEVGLDVDAIAECEEERGQEIVATEYELNQLLGVRGSPTVFIEGEQYGGARTPEGYKQAVCAYWDEDEKPEECSETLEGSTTQTPTGSC